MENKKWYKRTAVLFWFVLASLPVLLAFFQTIGTYLIHTDSLSLADIQTLFNNNSFNYNLTNITTSFSSYVPTFIFDLFDDLFDLIDTNMSSIWVVVWSWFAWTYFLHLLIDFIVWLPKLFHKWLDRWCD